MFEYRELSAHDRRGRRARARRCGRCDDALGPAAPDRRRPTVRGGVDGRPARSLNPTGLSRFHAREASRGDRGLGIVAAWGRRGPRGGGGKVTGRPGEGEVSRGRHSPDLGWFPSRRVVGVGPRVDRVDGTAHRAVPSPADHRRTRHQTLESSPPSPGDTTPRSTVATQNPSSPHQLSPRPPILESRPPPCGGSMPRSPCRPSRRHGAPRRPEPSGTHGRTVTRPWNHHHPPAGTRRQGPQPPHKTPAHRANSAHVHRSWGHDHPPAGARRQGPQPPHKNQVTAPTWPDLHRSWNHHHPPRGVGGRCQGPPGWPCPAAPPQVTAAASTTEDPILE